MGFSLSPDLSARDSNIGPRACPRSDIGRGLIDRVMTKNPCYDLFIIKIRNFTLYKKQSAYLLKPSHDTLYPGCRSDKRFPGPIKVISPADCS